MSEYTPSRLEVLCRYREWAGGSSSDRAREAEFDRWLVAHDAEVAAETLARWIAWADASPAVTWTGRLGLKERWEHRDDPEYQAMLAKLSESTREESL